MILFKRLSLHKNKIPTPGIGCVNALSVSWFIGVESIGCTLAAINVHLEWSIDPYGLMSLENDIYRGGETYTGDDKDASTYTNDGNSDSGSSQESEGKQQQDTRFVIDTIDTNDDDKDRITYNDTSRAADSGHINDDPDTSIMSKMSIMSTADASHSIEESGHDQPTNLQEQSTEEIKNDTNDTYKNVGNGDAYRPQFTTEKEILNINPVSHVTSAQGGADGIVIDISGQPSVGKGEVVNLLPQSKVRIIQVIGPISDGYLKTTGSTLYRKEIMKH
jgi:hypothetical protein